MLLVEETSLRTHTTASMRRTYRIDGVGAFGQTEDRRRVAWYAEAVGILSRCVMPPFTLRQSRGSEFASFASTAGGIHTYAERRAARQSSSARTAKATTPQVYPLLRRSSSARSPPRPAWPSSSVARA